MSNSLASMTGYARASGAASGCAFQVELKSVNGRGLDIRARLAPGLDALEIEARKRITAALTRGSVSLSIALKTQDAGGEVFINQGALDAVLKTIEILSGQVDARKPSLDGILNIRGVMEVRETALAGDAEEALHAAILEALDAALVQLRQAREAEGAQLQAVLLGCVDEIETLTAQAEAHPARTPSAIRDKLAAQIGELGEAGLSEERLHQEAMLLATKADIREELDRLTAHVHAARQLLKGGGAVGRKLDFLSQEFNREANTLCSKSNAVDLTAIGLELKAVIDRLREQIQNVE